MPRKSRKNVGLIGLGIIGSRVANALRTGGFHVYIWNRTPRAAPNFLASPRQVAELCDVIQIFVADAQALFDVLDTMGDALTPSHIILCNSTVGPEATLDAAKLVEARGAQFLDAPFTGSKEAAQNRELVYYIGGDDKTLEAAEPMLRASSKAIVKIGKIGDAAVIKVATNMISAVTVQTLAEAYAIVKESGIDPRMLAEALKNHAVRSGVTDAKLAKILDRDYEPHFSLKHMFKDVQLGIHIANSLDIDLPATTATAGVMYGGLTRGWADDDFSVLARTYQKEELPPSLSPPPGDAPLLAKPEEKAPGVEVFDQTPMPVLTGSPTPAVAPTAAPSEKQEAPRESTPGELRDAGIKVPEAPAAEAAKVEPAKPEAAKVESPKVESPKVESPKVESPKVEPPKDEPPKAEAKKEDPKEEKSPEPVAENGAPADPARQHTPFVRIRRWFGTGSAS